MGKHPHQTDRPYRESDRIWHRPPPDDPARDQQVKSRIQRRLTMGTRIAEDRTNEQILDSMRKIAKSQLSMLETAAGGRILTTQEAATLHQVAKVWNIVQSGTQREVAKLDLDEMSDEDLNAAAEYAESLLAKR